MTLTDQVIKNIIKRLVKGQDYRIEIVALINAEFLQFAIDFFKKVVEAKLANKDVTVDWYKEAFLNTKLSSDDIAINSGLNKKTITNMYNSATKEIVIDAANEHYDVLYQSISTLIEAQSDIDLTLTVKFRGVSVDLNINESLIVINTLAVKRSSLRGGAWASAGKQTEKILMIVLCKIFEVDEQYYSIKSKGKISKKSKKGAISDAEFDREIDFFYRISGVLPCRSYWHSSQTYGAIFRLVLLEPAAMDEKNQQSLFRFQTLLADPALTPKDQKQNQCKSKALKKNSLGQRDLTRGAHCRGAFSFSNI